jgi:hypothetical protein
MSRILKVNGDYRLQVQPAGNIILDTQSTGTVTVLGNLDVKGTTSYIESTITEIKDNILQLNYNSTYSGNGIPSALGYVSGIEVERGVYNSAQIVFNEQVNHYDALAGSQITGTWTLTTSGVNVNNVAGTASAGAGIEGLQARTIVTDGLADLAFDMLASSKMLAIVNVGGTVGLAGHTLSTSGTNYAGLNLQSYHIPNVGYLNNYVSSTYTPGGGQGVAIVDRLSYPPTNGTTSANANTFLELFSTNILIQVAQTTISTIDSNGLTTGYVRIGGGSGAQLNTITNTSSNNLIITANNNYVEFKAITQFDTPTTTLSTVVITGTGGTFTCASTTLAVNQSVTITGTISGATITGYTSPTTYYIIATNGSTTFTLSTSMGGLAIATTAGTPAGVTFTVGYAVTYNSTGTQIYSNSVVGPAKTGIYFANASNRTPDELVSRNRAVLLSILL